MGPALFRAAGLLPLLSVLVAVTDAAAPPPIGAADARLSARVKITARRALLPELLRQAGGQAGVELRAEGEALDLQATAFAEAPLREIMARLSLLFHLTWRLSGQTPQPTYILYAADEDRGAIRAALERDWATFRNDMKMLFRAFAQGEAPTGAERTDRKLKALRSSPSSRSAAAMVGELPPALFDACLRGREVRLDWNQMTPSFRKRFEAYLDGSYAEGQRLLGDPQLRDAAARDGGGFVEPKRKDPQRLVFYCGLDPQIGGGRSSGLKIGYLDPANGRPNGTTFHVWPAEQQEWPGKASQRHFESREVSQPPGADLTVPILISAWETSLEQFARQNRVSVISDAYDADDCPPVPNYAPGVWPPPKAEAARLLDQFCCVYDYNWNAASPVYVFRRRDWYALRERQFSRTQWQRWIERAERKGRYELQDLAEMAALGEPQKSRLLRYVGEEAWREVGRNEEVLAFYGLFDAARRTALERDGIGVSDLKLPQQHALAAVCSAARPPLPSGGLAGPTRVRVADEPGADHTSLVLLFRSGSTYEFRFASRPPKGIDP